MNKQKRFSRSVIVVALITGLILLIPLVAMQYTEEVVWDLNDFIAAGILLFGTGLMYLLITRKAVNITYRVAAGLALVSGFLLIWVNLAVGILGSEDNPANLLYGVVLAIGFLGAVISRFKPKGMAVTLFIMALAQMLVPVIAMFIWKPETFSPEESIAGVVGVNVFFFMLFIGSALLFRNSAREQPSGSHNIIE